MASFQGNPSVHNSGTLLELTDTLMPGVACLPHGLGHSRPGTRLGVAGERPGVSLNDLTDPLRLDALTGNAALNGLPIEVRGINAWGITPDRPGVS